MAWYRITLTLRCVALHCIALVWWVGSIQSNPIRARPLGGGLLSGLRPLDPAATDISRRPTICHVEYEYDPSGDGCSASGCGSTFGPLALAARFISASCVLSPLLLCSALPVPVATTFKKRKETRPGQGRLRPRGNFTLLYFTFTLLLFYFTLLTFPYLTLA